MELSYLRYFYEVAQCGSFTSAAHKLHISQSSLSKAVAQLEDQQGVQLLQRSKKGVSLTTTGKAVFEKAQSLFQTAIEIEDICRGKKERYEGNLKFGASDHIVNYLISKKISKLKSLYPSIVPSIFSGTPNDVITLLHNNEIEFGLFFTRVQMPSIVYKPLMNLDMALVCSRNLVPEFKTKISSQHLKNLFRTVGMIASIGSQYQKHPSKPIFDLIGENPKIVAESNSQETQKRFCLDGVGIGFLAKFMVEEEIKNKLLVEIPLEKPVMLDLHLAHKKEMILSPNAQVFLNLIK
jgi:LysR family transcriptional regulator, cyn operon transcriptional activator